MPCWSRGGAVPPAAPPSPAASLSAFPAPTPVTDIRTDKVEQKSVSLSWQEPGFPTANGTEYEVKYYEKVGSGTGSGPWPCPGRFPCQPALPLGLHPWVPVPLRVRRPPHEGRVVGRGGGACLRTVLLGRFYCRLRERGALQTGADEVWSSPTVLRKLPTQFLRNMDYL